LPHTSRSSLPPCPHPGRIGTPLLPAPSLRRCRGPRWGPSSTHPSSTPLPSSLCQLWGYVRVQAPRLKETRARERKQGRRKFCVAHPSDGEACYLRPSQPPCTLIPPLQ